MNASNLKASVVIPTYNRANELNLVLSGLLNQDIERSTFETIVVDDNSNDDTPNVIEKYSNKLNLNYIQKKDKVNSAAKSRNIGVEKSKNDLIIFLDSDVIPSPNFIKTHIEMHQKRCDAVVIGYVYGIDCDRKSLELRFGDRFNAPSNSYRSYLSIIKNKKFKHFLKDRRDYFFKKIKDDLNRLYAPWCYFWTLNASILKENLENVGFFDDNFLKKGSEDLELGYRLYLNNLKFYFIRDSFGFHIPHHRDYPKEAIVDISHELYFLMKFPNVDIETLCSYDCGHTNSILPSIKELIESPSFYSYKTVNNLFQFDKYIPSKGDNLLIGCTNEHLLENSNIRYVIEISKKRVVELKNKYPEIKFYNIIGTALPFKNQSFRAVIFNDAWRCYSDRLLSRILYELFRVGERVILVKNLQWTPPDISFVNDKIDNNDKPYWGEFIWIPSKINYFDFSLLYSEENYSIYEVIPKWNSFSKEEKNEILKTYHDFIGGSDKQKEKEEEK